MIIVAGQIRVRSKDRELFVARSAEAARLARAADGCLDFSVSPDPIDPERVNVQERWTDRASLLAFREDGPDDDLDTLILSADVDEFELSSPDASGATPVSPDSTPPGQSDATPVSPDLASPTPDDERWLRRAIELSENARKAGNPPFGSLLVDADGKVLAEETNTTVTESDLSLHPELKLAVWAGENLDPETARGTTMYTSCENCAMCSAAMVQANIGTLVFALSGETLRKIRPAKGATLALSSRQVFARASQPIEVRGPALEVEAGEIHTKQSPD